jgi:hypothetical protein
MQIVHVLIIALALTRLASADNFIFTINPSTETASVSDGDKSCLLAAGCSGGAISFFCGGIGGTIPTFCDLQYNREEFITDPAAGCDPSNISLPLCPNDMTPLFETVAVIDSVNNIEGVFTFQAFSHSLVGDYFTYDFDLLPFPISDYGYPINAYVVDNGKVQSLDAMIWTDGIVDTFQVQFVPEASSVGLLSSVVLICGLLRWRNVLSGLRTLGRLVRC